MARVKGAAIVESVRVLRRHKDSARTHLPPALHHYLEERVLAASWYPAEDQIPLTRAVARVLGEPEHGFYEKAGRFAAQRHAEGVYRHLVKAEDSETLCRRALVLWSSQHDTGAMEMQVQGAGCARVALRDFRMSTREMCLLNAGYIAATFENAGCEGVRVEHQSCCCDGAPVCTWLVSWLNKIRV